MNVLSQAEPAIPGEHLNSWWPLWILLAAFAAIVVTLGVLGRRADRPAGPLAWVALGLERVTKIPGWAAGMIGTAAFGLLVAGIGFYNDVSWHVGRGRDDELFTAPHTMIVVGLGLITLASAIGIVAATIQRADTPLRLGALRIPWSAVPLGLLGICALGGFPLDELWHGAYGVDVTMWSPTHMLMICGAAFSLIAAWLALAEAGVEFGRSVWTRVVHFLAAWFVLAGLSAPLGEFRFGVPQFQQLYHPVLLGLAAAFAFVPTRIVLGRGWALALGAATFLPELGGGIGGSDDGFVPTRTPGSFVAAALAVELVAAIWGVERRLRFAVLAGLGVATLGLAGEWVWNQGAPQPWNAALLPGALVVGGLVAVGAAVLGAAYGGAVARQTGRIPGRIIGLAAVAVIAGLLLPLPRRGSDVTASITLDRRGDMAVVSVALDPPDAADEAKWFQVIAWQGGGFRVSELRETAPGRFVTEEAVPVTGRWKTMVRLHRGAEMVSAPVFLPEDPEIGAPEIPAVDRRIRMETEERYLMREVTPGPATVRIVAYSAVTLVVIAWAAAFVLACSRIPRRGPVLPAAWRDGSAAGEGGDRPDGGDGTHEGHHDAAADRSPGELSLTGALRRPDQSDDVAHGQRPAEREHEVGQ